MNKVWIVPIIFLMYSQIVVAAECKYPNQSVVSTEVKQLPFDKSGNQLQELILQFDEGINRDLKISNPNRVRLNAKIQVTAHIKDSRGFCAVRA